MLFVGLTFCSCFADEKPGVCIADRAEMPNDWQSSNHLKRKFRDDPWSKHENQRVEYAIDVGVNEIIQYFHNHPSSVLELWDDSIEALIQLSYASANSPVLDGKLREASRKNLKKLLRRYGKKHVNAATCADVEQVLPVAIFANRLLAADNASKRHITAFTNAAFNNCTSLDDATGLRQSALIENRGVTNSDIEDLFEFYIWALWLLEAEYIPDLTVPDEAKTFPALFWQHVGSLNYRRSDRVQGGSVDDTFFALADLVTHIVHIPTAVHRFPLFVEDHPELYNYHRQNFYKALSNGDLDLFASFLDSLKQYGCTPANDIQVRDGMRHLMSEFSRRGERWIVKDTENALDAIDHYELIHKPWTALLGLRDRILKEPEPKSFGHFIRQKLSLPIEKN